MSFRSQHAVSLWLFGISVIVIRSTMLYATAAGNGQGFQKHNFCDLSGMISGGCLIKEFSGSRNSIAQCAVSCADDSNCKGAVLDQTTESCYFQRQCDRELMCEQNEPGFIFFRKTGFCYNGGSFDHNGNKCICPTDWIGTLCERRPTSCREMVGYIPTWVGVWVTLDIYGNGSKLVPTRCGVNSGTPRTYILQSYGHSSFNNTYQEYVRGFKLGNVHYWLGLENMVFYSHQGEHRVVFDVHFTTTDHHRMYLYYYDSFKTTVGDDGEYYISNNGVPTYKDANIAENMTLADCITKAQGLPFSTWDHDLYTSATDGLSCASRAGAGWWFGPNCSGSCNPLGERFSINDPPPRKTSHIYLPDLHLDQETMWDQYSYTALYYEHI